jgi:hypothetical protein
MGEEDFEKEWDRRIVEIRERAARLLPRGSLVRYGAYEEDADRLPVDNLEKVAVEGRCIFVQKHDPYYGDGKDYVSAEMLNPTWLQVCALANEMILVTRDEHHVFFEGVTVLREENGVKVVDFDMGS